MESNLARHDKEELGSTGPNLDEPEVYSASGEFRDDMDFSMVLLAPRSRE